MKILKKFFKTLFREDLEKTFTEHTLFLETFPLPRLKENKILLCKDLTEKEFYKDMIFILYKLYIHTAYVQNRCISKTGRLISDI